MSAKKKAKTSTQNFTRSPKQKWSKVYDFVYDIRDTKTGAIFVYIGQRETSLDELNASLDFIHKWGFSSIEKGRIHYLLPVPKS